MVTAWSLRHFILLATKHDTNEPSAKRGKTHFSPASSGHWLGQGQNLPKLVKRETLKSHLLLQSFCFLLPLNGPRILSVLPGSQDQTRHMVVPQGSAVLLPLSHAKHPQGRLTHCYGHYSWSGISSAAHSLGPWVPTSNCLQGASTRHC